MKWYFFREAVIWSRLSKTWLKKQRIVLGKSAHINGKSKAHCHQTTDTWDEKRFRGCSTPMKWWFYCDPVTYKSFDGSSCSGDLLLHKVPPYVHRGGTIKLLWFAFVIWAVPCSQEWGSVLWVFSLPPLDSLSYTRWLFFAIVPGDSNMRTREDSGNLIGEAHPSIDLGETKWLWKEQFPINRKKRAL